VITIIIITVVAGVLVGFATSARTTTDSLEDLTRNILVGTAGAFVSLQIAGRLYGSSDTGTSAITLVIAAIAGAMLLLFIVNRVLRA
jgi:uncharacterized membrane protein YeaQ/YmgE (transglycosylase-associated protein family)